MHTLYLVPTLFALVATACASTSVELPPQPDNPLHNSVIVIVQPHEHTTRFERMTQAEWDAKLADTRTLSGDTDEHPAQVVSAPEVCGDVAALRERFTVFDEFPNKALEWTRIMHIALCSTNTPHQPISLAWNGVPFQNRWGDRAAKAFHTLYTQDPAAYKTQERPWVLIDHSQPAYTLFLSVEGPKVAELRNVIKNNPQSNAAIPLQVFMDTHETKVFERMTTPVTEKHRAVLETFRSILTQGMPVGISWNGGVLVTNTDYKNAKSTWEHNAQMPPQDVAP